MQAVPNPSSRTTKLRSQDLLLGARKPDILQDILYLLVSAPRRHLENSLNKSDCKSNHHSILTLE